MHELDNEGPCGLPAGCPFRPQQRTFVSAVTTPNMGSMAAGYQFGLNAPSSAGPSVTLFAHRPGSDDEFVIAASPLWPHEPTSAAWLISPLSAN